MENGVEIIRNAFDPEEIKDVLQTAWRHQDDIVAKARTDIEDFGFDEVYGFHRPALEYNLIAIDPDRTILKPVTTGPARELLRELVGSKPEIKYDKVRIVVPGVTEQNGHLPIHIERGAVDYPDVHVIWMPLVKADQVTNRDVPGIQFFLGRREFFLDFDADKELVFSYIATLGPHIADPEPYEDEYGKFWRPEMRLGDIAVFDGLIPHTAFIPLGCEQPRTAFDVRLIPN